MGNVIRDFIVRFGFQGNTGGVRAFDAAVERAAQSARNAGGSLDGLSNHAQRAEGSMANLGSSVRNLVAGYLGFQAIKGVATGILTANNEFEKLNVQLVTIEGSQAKADKAFGLIEKFASKTPYSLGQVTEAFIKLKQMGMDPSEDALTAYGNTASSMGKPLSQMIEAVADAATGEFERLKEFGIKTKKSGDQVEFTFKGIKKKVKNDSKSIQEYLKQIGKVDFAGAMNRQSKTLEGIMSNLGDNMGRIARKIGKGGLLDALKEAAGGAVDLSGDMDGLATTIGKALGTAVRWLTAHFRTIVTVLGAVAGGLVALKVGEFAMWVWNGVKALRAMALAGALANAGVMLLPLAIGAAIIAIGLIAEDIYQFATGGKSVLGGLVKKFPELGKAVDGAVAFFRLAIPIVVEFATMTWEAIKYYWGLIGPLAASLFGGVFAFVAAFATNAATVFWAFSQAAAGIIMGVVEFIAGVWQQPSAVFSLFGVLVQTVFANIANYVRTVVGSMVGLIGQAIGVDIPGTFGAMGRLVTSTFSGMWTSIANYVDRIIETIMMIPNAVTNAMSGLGSLAMRAAGMANITPASSIGPTMGRNYGNAGNSSTTYNGGTTNVATNNPAAARAAVSQSQTFPRLIAAT